LIHRIKILNFGRRKEEGGKRGSGEGESEKKGGMGEREKGGRENEKKWRMGVEEGCIFNFPACQSGEFAPRTSLNNSG
jgi:hypothetical protein